VRVIASFTFSFTPVSSVLKDFGITHISIASKLRQVIEQCENIRKNQNAGLHAPITLTTPALKLPMKNSDSVTLTLIHRTFMGAQHSLFSSSIHKSSWNDEYKIISPSLELNILVGGNTNSGVIEYIEKYGFYEGGGARFFFSAS